MLFNIFNGDENMIVISACLGGIACRYDGNDNLVSKIGDLLQQEETPHLPRSIRGLPTPRRPQLKLLAGMAMTF